jgi:LPPG:FO 2-phospho-L-lactate transferase
MFQELGIPPSALAVAQHYQGLVRGFVLDQIDAALAGTVAGLEMETLVTETLMRSPADRARLAKEVIDFGLRIMRQGEEKKRQS